MGLFSFLKVKPAPVMMQTNAVFEGPTHSIFTYKVGPQRQAAAKEKQDMHGGINQVLRKNGIKPVDNCYQAIQICEKKNLLPADVIAKAKKINIAGNKANHKWYK